MSLPDVVGLTLTDAGAILKEQGFSYEVRLTGPPGKTLNGDLRVIQIRVIGPAQMLLVCAHHDLEKGGGGLGDKDHR